MQTESLGQLCDELKIWKSRFLTDLERTGLSSLKKGHVSEIYVHVRSQEISFG